MCVCVCVCVCVCGYGCVIMFECVHVYVRSVVRVVVCVWRVYVCMCVA